MPERQIYTKNFLEDVIVKIDYPPILSLLENAPSTFQEKIASTFPILEPIIQQGIIIDTQSNVPNAQKTTRTTWRFTSKDKTKTVEIDSEYLVIGVKKYTSYTEFKELVTSITAIFFELYPEIVINRLGLRYVNKINIKDADLFNWENKIDSNLIAPLAFIENKEVIRRSVQAFVLAIDEDTNLTFRCGISNSVYPNKPVSKEYLLDYDCFTTIQFEKGEMLTKLDKYNQIITDYFEQSIEEELRETMMQE